MYRSALSLLALCLLWINPGQAQTEKVDIGAGRFTIYQIIETVEGQTRYSFAYDGSIIDVNRWIELQRAAGTIENLLGTMGSQLPYTFTLYNRYILINPDGGIANAPKPKQQKTDVPAVISREEDYDGTDTVTEKDEQPGPETVIAEVILPDTVKVIIPKEEEPYSEYISPFSPYVTSQRKFPQIAIKTNLLYAAAAFTPNLGAEVQIGDRSTIELSGGYNWYKREGTQTDNKKLVHWFLRPEYRYWFCQPFNGHFMGAQAFYGRYNISAHNLPWLFGKNSRDHRFEGDGFGLGVSYGYNLILGQRWNAEFTAGVGYARLNYEKFACDRCSRDIGKFHRNYFGPTRIGISIVYLLK